jgi:ATPase subunit of ABC transporter with duplicated ATPase domains
MAPKKALEKPQTLQVTAQQSRFHTDLLSYDAPSTKEILVKNLSISLGQKEILSGANLHLKDGCHYVLVGRNGVGKSTLLKAIAEGQVPGIPWLLNILVLGQSRELTLDDAVGGLSIGEGETVLQHVLRADEARERLQRESRILSTALESRDPTLPMHAYRRLSHERLEKRLLEARKIAERRSGARGATARRVLNTMEEEVAKSEERVNEDLSGLEAGIVASETKAAVDMLSEVSSQLEMMDAEAAEAKARTVLLGLGFSKKRVEGPVAELSGGWRTRCDLACALAQKPDVLFLDEPTNFLDLPSVIWLEHYLKTLKDTTVVVVTHDRDFADAAAEELLVMRNQKIEVFKGNLSLYESERWKKAKWMNSMREAQEKQKAHMEKTISNNIAAAKKQGDDKKLKQAASRKKKLDDRMGMQVNAKGHKFKLNRDLGGGYYLTSRVDFETVDFDPPVRLKFPNIPPDLRFPGALVNLEKVAFGYKKNKPIFSDVDLTIHPGERVGICGLNGSGKTTLLNLIVGIGEDGSPATPTSGTITRHPRAKFARFSQLVVEQLDAFAAENPTTSALAHLIDISGGQLDNQAARGLLGSLGLQGQVVSDIPIAALSGGQKVRLAFAKLVYQPLHILVLDEVGVLRRIEKEQS